MSVADFARQRQHEREGKLGNGRRAVPRYARDSDAAFFRLFRVHVVDAGRARRDKPQFGEAVHLAGAHGAVYKNRNNFGFSVALLRTLSDWSQIKNNINAGQFVFYISLLPRLLAEINYFHVLYYALTLPPTVRTSLC